MIGLGLDTSYLTQFQCVGEFLSAENEDSFKSVLKFVISQALNNTTAQINLNNINNLPYETDLTMSLYNSLNGKLMHTYIRTLNRYQNPDTISLDPLYTYKLVVHSIPEVILDSIKLIPGKHNVINVSSPLGKLNLKLQGNDNIYNGISCIVKMVGESPILNVQKMNSTKQYLVGNYDLEILTLPRIKFNNIKINQSRLTDIIIPLYGSIQLSKSDGPAALFLKSKGQNIWVYDFNENRSIENLNIQPGKYFISFRSKRSNSTAHTILKEFGISSGQNINLKL